MMARLALRTILGAGVGLAGSLGACADDSSVPAARKAPSRIAEAPPERSRAAPLPAVRSRGYRVLAGPVVLYAQLKSGPAYVVYIRMNKPLPRRREAVLINGGADDVDVSSRPSHCYTARLFPESPRDDLGSKPQDGRPVVVDVASTDALGRNYTAHYLQIAARARRVTPSQISNGDKYVKPRLRRLGCKSPSD